MVGKDLGDHPLPYFITMIPIVYKINNFSIHLHPLAQLGQSLYYNNGSLGP